MLLNQRKQTDIALRNDIQIVCVWVLVQVIADNGFKNTTNLKYRKSCYPEVDDIFK